MLCFRKDWEVKSSALQSNSKLAVALTIGPTVQKSKISAAWVTLGEIPRTVNLRARSERPCNAAIADYEYSRWGPPSGVPVSVTFSVHIPHSFAWDNEYGFRCNQLCYLLYRALPCLMIHGGCCTIACTLLNSTRSHGDDAARWHVPE